MIVKVSSIFGQPFDQLGSDPRIGFDEIEQLLHARRKQISEHENMFPYFDETKLLSRLLLKPDSSRYRSCTDSGSLKFLGCFWRASTKAATNVPFLGDLILAVYRRDLQLSVLEELVGEINVHETGESSV